jgi:hypothetical protein
MLRTRRGPWLRPALTSRSGSSLSPSQASSQATACRTAHRPVSLQLTIRVSTAMVLAVSRRLS